MGFLHDEEDQPIRKRKPTPAERKHNSKNRAYYNAGGCDVCVMNKRGHMLDSPKMEATGTSSPLIYILAEAPGEQEDRLGVQLVGKAGSYFWDTVGDVWPSDFYRTDDFVRKNNVLNCRPPGNATPEFAEIECCRPRIVADIERTRPPFVLCLGGVASNWVTGDNSGINLWRGRWAPAKIGNHVCWTYHMYHPSYVLRTQGDYRQSPEEDMFALDLKNFAQTILNQELDRPVVLSSGYTDNIITITGNEPNALNLVREHLKDFSPHSSKYKIGVLGVDIETNGLRPSQVVTPKIASIAIGIYEKTVSIALDHPWAGWSVGERAELDNMIVECLTNSIPKVAHNTMFEQEWLGSYYGTEVITKVDWRDTMAQACALDQRLGMLSLDTLTTQNFGFPLKSLTEVDFKKVLQTPLETLLPYGGMDTKYTALLYQVQQNRLDANPSLKWTVRNIVESGSTMVLSQLEGIPVDWDRVAELKKKLGERLEVEVAEFLNLPEVKLASRRFGGFNHRSNLHLVHLFRDILKRPEGQQKSGGYTTKEEALSEMKDVDCALSLLKVRVLEKVISTYIDSLPETVHRDKKLHPKFETMLTRTGRFSSREPNIQNFPKRKHSEVRQIVVPPEGHVLVSLDYAQLEARCIAMASRDAGFMEALWTGFDIHSHYASRMVEEYPEWLNGADWNDPKIKKEKRQEVKNQFVFALFYGSVFKSIAKSMGLPDHTAEFMVGEFWRQFGAVKEWQERTISEYQQHGYTETLHGRRRQGPMKRNEIINTPIQGCGSDIVTAAGNRICQRHGIVPAFNVHDDLSFFIRDDDRLDGDIQTIATEMTRPVEDWMIVPLVVEISKGPRWGEQEEIGVLSSETLHSHKRE